MSVQPVEQPQYGDSVRYVDRLLKHLVSQAPASLILSEKDGLPAVDTHHDNGVGNCDYEDVLMRLRLMAGVRDDESEPARGLIGLEIDGRKYLAQAQFCRRLNGCRLNVRETCTLE